VTTGLEEVVAKKTLFDLSIAIADKEGRAIEPMTPEVGDILATLGVVVPPEPYWDTAYTFPEESITTLYGSYMLAALE
jgi:ArsR family metal-binding transcriptional regulator